MKPYRILLTIIFSLTMSAFACQAIAAEKTIKLQPVSETSGKLEVTNTKPKTISTKTSDKLQPVTKSSKKIDALGFCCKDGEISQLTANTCKKERGTFFRTEREAIQRCQGYCCDDFKVFKATEPKCKSARGKYFGNKQQAYRFCESQKGFCCIDGETRQLTSRECTAKRGEFYTSKKIAAKECKQEVGYCNLKGKTRRLTEDQCIKKKGNYFTTPVLANKDLVQLRQQEHAAKSKAAADVKLKKNLGTASTLALQKNPGQLTLSRPDLMPTRVWVNPATCRLWAEWENRGAAAPEKTFTERFILNGSFRHGSTPMTGYSFDSRNGFPIPAGYKLNSEVTDLYEIVILGETNVKFIIDGTGVHSETNENNNTMEVSVNCKPQLELQKKELAVKPLKVPELQTQEADKQVRNFPPETQVMNFDNQTLAKQLTEKQKPVLSAKKVELSLKKPDLSVTLEPPDEVLYQNYDYTFVGKVTNIGTADSPASRVTLSVFSGTGTVPIGSHDVPELTPHTGHTYRFESNIPTTSLGPKELILQVDSPNLIDEKNEENNIASHDVICEKPHSEYDLGLFESGSQEEDGLRYIGYKDEPVDFTITVYNFIDNSTSPATDFTVICDGQWNQTAVVVDPIHTAEGNSNSREFHFTKTWKTVGNYNCRVQLSGAPGYIDYNNQNNLMSFLVQVTGPLPASQ